MDLRKVNDMSYKPIKGDNLLLNDRPGILLDEQFSQIQWLDNDEIENWTGGYESFVNAGGFVLVI
jgi:hypothetical protein